jgi:Patatin-like phospholipase
MSFFGQSHIPGIGNKDYNKQDVWQNTSDISDIISLFTDQTRKEIMSLVVQSEWLAKLKNIIYSSLRESIDRKGDVRKFGWFDRINPLYKQLGYLYEVIVINPNLRDIFFQALELDIRKTLGKTPRKNTDINIANMIENITPENFQKNLDDIENKVWHAGVIYCLEECVREWKVLSEVECMIQSKQQESLANATLEDLDYVNLASLLAFHKKINTTENQEWVSFSLSGGISNAFSQLGIIKRTLASWQKIRSISGTSMGGILAILVSKAIEKDGSIDNLITVLKEKFYKKWKLYVKKIASAEQEESLQLSTKPVDQRYDIRDIFLELAHAYGITDDTRFDELKIPVIVNASYQSPKWEWEKEVILSGNEKIIDSVRVWANMPGRSTDNHGILGRQAVRGLALVDFAANEKWNPVSLLIRSGIMRKWIIGVDVGYSSVKYNTWAAQFSRWFFPDALVRDFVPKFWVVNDWWLIYVYFSADIIDRLIWEWEEAYDTKNPKWFTVQ